MSNKLSLIKTKNTDAIINGFIRDYQKNSKPISVDFRSFSPELSSADRATHLLHPYPAKLLMHIPYFFLSSDIFSSPGDLVADPFTGSGTVLLESILAGRKVLGADSNPFARLLAEVKISPISARTLKRSTDSLYKRIKPTPSGFPPDVVNLNYWFHQPTIEQLQCIHESILKTRNKAVRNFFRICFSNCARKVSLADPRVSVPVRMKASHYSKNHPLRSKVSKHLKQLKGMNVLDVFKDVVARNSKRLNRLNGVFPNGYSVPEIYGDARHLKKRSHRCDTGEKIFPKERVQLIITSPPYPGAQKYIRSSSLSLGWLGLCASNELIKLKLDTIGREEIRKKTYKKLKKTGILDADNVLERIYERNPIRASIASMYLIEMRASLTEMYRLLKPGGHLILVVANNTICKIKFKTVEYLQTIAEDIGFDPLFRLIDDIHSRGLMTKRNKTASIITREWVLVFFKG